MTDETLNLHDRLIGRFFAKSKYKHGQQFVEAAPALQETVKVFVKVGVALVDAKDNGTDPFAAIEGVLPWEEFTAHVAAAAALNATRKSDFLGLVGEYYGQLRRYAPSLLKAFDFGAAPAVGSAPQRGGHTAHLERDGYPQGTSGCADRLRAQQLGAVRPN